MPYKYGSLFWTIRNHIKIAESRKDTVIDILKANGIQTESDLQENPIPFKGLTSNEIRQLQILKDNYKTIVRYRESIGQHLFHTIGRFTSKHEQRRIFNLLKSVNILSERSLFATSNDKLRKIYGIGPKSMHVLQCVKNDFIEKSSRTFVGSPASGVPFQPLLMPLAQ